MRKDEIVTNSNNYHSQAEKKVTMVAKHGIKRPAKQTTQTNFMNQAKKLGKPMTHMRSMSQTEI